jgi:hypothetical protein
MPSSHSHIHMIIADQPAKLYQINICQAWALKELFSKCLSSTALKVLPHQGLAWKWNP